VGSVDVCNLKSQVLKMPVDVLSFAYAATVAAGGIVGYAKAGKNSSKPVEEHSYVVGDGGFYYSELLFYDT
jgi:hypothetical protein